MKCKLADEDQHEKIRWDVMQTSSTTSTLQALALLQREELEKWDFRHTFQQVLNLLLDVTESQLGFIAEIASDADGKPSLRMQSMFHVPRDAESKAQQEQSQNSDIMLHAPHSLIDAVIHTRQPVISNNPGRDERAAGVPDGHPALTSFLGLPLIKADTLIGMVGLANRDDGYGEQLVSSLDLILTVSTSLIFSNLQMQVREKSKNILMASEERYRRLFETISQGVIYRAANGTIIAANPAAERIFGLSFDQLCGAVVSAAGYQAIRDDGSLVAYTELPTIKALRTGRAVGPVTLGVLDPQTDQPRWLSVCAVPLFRPGDKGPFQAYAVFEDISRQKQAEVALTQSERLYRLAQTASGVGIWDWDLVNDHVLWDPYCWTMLGEEPQQQVLCYADWCKRVHPGDLDIAEQEIYKQLAVNDSFSIEFRLRTAAHDWLWINGHGRVVETDSDGKPARIMGTHSNIQHQKSAELAMHKKNADLELANGELRLLSTVFTHAGEGIIITTTDGIIVDANEAFCRICGYQRTEVIGRNPRVFQSGDQAQSFYNDMWLLLISHGHWTGELWNRHKDGRRYCQTLTISAVPDTTGVTQYYVGLVSDITVEKEHQRQLEYIAHFDSLTGLPNRKLLADRLQLAMAYTNRHGLMVGVAYIDLDGFKAINDNHGHDVGDYLLKVIAERMKACLRDCDTVARFGGDEFVVVLTELEDPSDAISSIQRLLEVIAQPVLSGNIQLQVSASIGIAYYFSAISMEPDHLLRHADQAMYQAKLTGKNRYHVFDTAQDRTLRDHHVMLGSIQTALDADEFVLYYQPKVNMRTGDIIGVEGLIRWNHPEKGLLAPGAFLPALEKHPLGITLGEWVINTALAQVKDWQDKHLNLPISVNIAACHLQQADFVERLRYLLAKYPDVSSDKLTLEVLETSEINDINRIATTISNCTDVGVAVALDDFGTGYSSLAYLRRLPVQILKIDQGFIRDMLFNPDDLAILEGIMGLATAFRRQTIAEGVETVAHGEMLLDLGCDLAQGYGIARPMPANELPSWIARWQPYSSWSNRPSLRPEKVPLLAAAVYHRGWVANIEACINGQGSAPPLDSNACRFSVWMAGDGKRLCSGQEEFREVEKIHYKIHTLGQSLVEMKKQGTGEKALMGLDGLFLLRDRLLDLLNQVMFCEN